MQPPIYPMVAVVVYGAAVVVDVVDGDGISGVLLC
jgi:hypothetical protein